MLSISEYEQNWQTPNQIPPRRRLPKLIFGLVLLIGVYILGLNVGNGNLGLNHLKSSTKEPSASSINYSSLGEIYKLLQKDFDGQLNSQKLLDGAKSGFVSATGDPYTEYFNPADARDFNNELTGSFTGIGAELGSDGHHHIVIIAPLAGYPAAKAGLKPKDIISAVDGQPTTGQSIDEAVNEIRGPAGSNVSLTIIRGSQPAFQVTIKRAKITLPSVTSKIEGQIGYIKISQFAADTPDLAQKAAQQFVNNKVKAVILDLRDDPGGYLDSAVKVSSLWLNEGKTVVSERRGNVTLDTLTAEGHNILAGLPTVVLINEGSASASEITAGALHDNHAATLLGSQSFGKGSVQQVEDLTGGAELKITVARWYTPDGKNIDKQGITPDILVKISAADQKAHVDVQKNKAEQFLRSKI